MFRQDQKEISLFAQSNPNAMARVITFVYLTIQQSIFDMPDFMKDVDENGVNSKFIWGFKINAYEWLNDNKETVYHTIMDTYRGYADPLDSEHELLKAFAAMPGLGLVKGGFCNQLIFGYTGCIDTHNINIFGTNPTAFTASRFKRAKAATRNRLSRDYMGLCADLGGPEHLWDNWCEYVAERNNTSPEAVSRLHTQAIME